MVKQVSNGMKQYENILMDVCNVGDLQYLRSKEWEGCIGVACVLAFIKDVSPNIQSLSEHLELPYNDINLSNAFNRLRDNGVFNRKYKDDEFLKGTGRSFDDNKYVNREYLCKQAWCYIAGIASGFTGMRDRRRGRRR